MRGGIGTLPLLLDGPPVRCKLTLRNNLVVNLAYNNAGVVLLCPLRTLRCRRDAFTSVGIRQPNRSTPVDVEEYLGDIFYRAFPFATQRFPRNNPWPSLFRFLT